MPNYFHIMRLASRVQVYLANSILHSSAYISRYKAESSLKEKCPLAKNSFVIKYYTYGKENVDFDNGRKCLLKKINLSDQSSDQSWNVVSSNSHANEDQHNGRGGHGWSLAIASALSIISTKAEGEEEKKESELLILIKRGILALKVGHNVLFY